MIAYNRYLSVRLPDSGIEIGGAQTYEGLRVKQPIKMTASCSMTAEATPNDAQVTIYNMAESTAKQLFESGNWCEIWAGYAPEGEEQSIGMMFRGKIKNVTSSVSGIERTWVIDIGDGADAYKAASVVDKAKDGDLKKSAEVAAKAMNEQYGIEIGAIKLGKQITTGKTITYNGDYARDVLDDVAVSTNSKWQIANGKLEMTPRDEVSESSGLVLSPKTGLIGYPKITDDGVEVETIVIPNVYPNMSIVVDSRYGAGTYQINQIDMALSNTTGDHKFTMRQKNMTDQKNIEEPKRQAVSCK